MADENKKNEIAIIDENDLRNKVYIVRGVQVMLDFELAEIYGYTTTRFNEQVSRNIDKFDSEFMFELTKAEFGNLISQNATSSWGGRRKLPRAFTEQGVYMLMTVLRSELATIQSKKLIKLFKGMKDYIIENQQLMIAQKDFISLARKVESNTDDIRKLRDTVANAVTRADLSEIMKIFDAGIEAEEILILDGQPFKADLAYQKIIKQANKSIMIVDDYVGIKTLQHLTKAKKGVAITIVSDNKKKTLRAAEYNDFLSEYPKIIITLLKSSGRVHDRYIILDYGTKDMKVYHSGASVKDAGRRITTITRLTDITEYKSTVKSLMNNPPLVLR